MVTTVVGNGNNTKFWYDEWLMGKSPAEIAQVLTLVPKRIAKSWSVKHALVDNNWIGDIRGVFSVQILVEFLLIWDLVAEVGGCPWLGLPVTLSYV